VAEFQEFVITQDKLDTGLRGFPIGYCSTSEVKPNEGLFYIGKPIKELASKSPEEVIFLLFNGKEGSSRDLDQFKKELQQRSLCNSKIVEYINQLPREAHPMDLFSCALSIASTFEKKNDWREDCLNLIAKIPEIVAHIINFHGNFGKTPVSKPELGYMQNFTQMLNLKNSNKELLGEVLTLFNVLHFDHGGGNLSTFVGKAVSSGLEDMYGSIAAAMNALNGPRHGRANQDCLEFLYEIQGELKENIDEPQLDRLLRKRLEEGKLVFGFGHAVLRVEDTRAAVLYEWVKKKNPDHPLVKLALVLREVGPKILKENPKITDPYPNVDAISGTALVAAGFNYPEYFTLLFGLSRTVGIAIQILHERVYARDGKGVPIYRPKYVFKKTS
jgi:citrate synthase